MLERIQKEHGHEGEKYYILFLVALTETAFHVWGELMESTEREHHSRTTSIWDFLSPMEPFSSCGRSHRYVIYDHSHLELKVIIINHHYH